MTPEKDILSSDSDTWTEARIRSYGARMDGVSAVQAVYGYAPSKAYSMLASGDVDFRVIRRGRKYIVPTADVLRLLGLDGQNRAA